VSGAGREGVTVSEGAIPGENDVLFSAAVKLRDGILGVFRTPVSCCLCVETLINNLGKQMCSDIVLQKALLSSF
jgi:hypothetical protein